MKNLKVGDKVRCKTCNIASFTKNKEYKIIDSDFVIDDYGRKHLIYTGEVSENNWFNKNFDIVQSKDLPLAVRVTNEREFRAVMENFKDRGWKPNNGYPFVELKFPRDSTFMIIELEDSFVFIHLDNESKDYNVLSFAQFCQVANMILQPEIKLAEGATATLSDGRIEFNESVMSLAKSDIINLFNLIQ